MVNEKISEVVEDLLKNVEGTKSFYLSKVGHEGIVINGDERYHAASVIKLFYLYTVLKLVEEGHLDLSERYVIEKDEQVGGAGVIQLLTPGTRLELKELLYLMIDVSDNTATNMVFDIIGKERLNDYIKGMGTIDTCSPRKLMKVIPGLYSYTNVKDVALCLEHLYTEKSLTSDSVKLAKDILIHQQFNDSLNKRLITCSECGTIFEEMVYCNTCQKHANEVEEVMVPFYHKTGEIDGVVHDAGILVIDDKPYILILMTKDLTANILGRDLHGQVGELVYKSLKK